MRSSIFLELLGSFSFKRKGSEAVKIPTSALRTVSDEIHGLRVESAGMTKKTRFPPE